jgi:hypothetical protein
MTHCILGYRRASQIGLGIPDLADHQEIGKGSFAIRRRSRESL